MKNRFFTMALAIIAVCLAAVSCFKNDDETMGRGWIRFDGKEYVSASASRYTNALSGIENGTVYAHDIMTGAANMRSLVEFNIYSAGTVPVPGEYALGLDESYGDNDQARYIRRADRLRLVVDGVEITAGDPAQEGTITVVTSTSLSCELRGEITLLSGRTVSFRYEGRITSI